MTDPAKAPDEHDEEASDDEVDEEVFRRHSLTLTTKRPFSNHSTDRSKNTMILILCNDDHISFWVKKNNEQFDKEKRNKVFMLLSIEALF